MGRFIDLTGQRFGKLTVLYLIEESRKEVNKKWKCRCDCGTEVSRDGRSLIKGVTKGVIATCGTCIERKNAKLEGKRFGRLIVVKKAEKVGYWDCLCDCGTEKPINGYNLLKGIANSCGCISREKTIERNKRMATHHMTDSRPYNIWDTMKARCYNPNSKDYKNYGARGITICEEWKSSFENFYGWARGNGYEDHLTLDRIDVNGNYQPSNCRWATTKQQGNNTRVNRHITIDGETKTIAEWSEIAGISPKALRYRIEAGWNEEDLLVPVGVQKVYVTIGEYTKCLSDWAKEYGVSTSIAYNNYSKGFQREEIFQSRKKETFVEINGVRKSLSQWAKDTGLKYCTLHVRYRKGIRGEALLKPVCIKNSPSYEQLSLF